MENVQSAEEERGENADVRTPHGEDNERDSEPAAVTEAVIGPYAAGIVHHIIESAETGDHAAGAGGDILIFCDVDARRVRRVGVFAHGTKLEADARAAQDIRADKRNNNGGVGKETVGEENLAEPAELTGKRERCAEKGARARKSNGGDIRAGELDE